MKSLLIKLVILFLVCFTYINSTRYTRYISVSSSQSLMKIPSNLAKLCGFQPKKIPLSHQKRTSNTNTNMNAIIETDQIEMINLLLKPKVSKKSMTDCLRKYKLQNNIFKNLQLNYLKTRNDLFNKIPKKHKIDNVSLNNIIVKLKQTLYNTKRIQFT